MAPPCAEMTTDKWRGWERVLEPGVVVEGSDGVVLEAGSGKNKGRELPEEGGEGALGAVAGVIASQATVISGRGAQGSRAAFAPPVPSALLGLAAQDVPRRDRHLEHSLFLCP